MHSKSTAATTLPEDGDRAAGWTGTWGSPAAATDTDPLWEVAAAELTRAIRQLQALEGQDLHVTGILVDGSGMVRHVYPGDSDSGCPGWSLARLETALSRPSPELDALTAALKTGQPQLSDDKPRGTTGGGYQLAAAPLMGTADRPQGAVAVVWQAGHGSAEGYLLLVAALAELVHRRLTAASLETRQRHLDALIHRVLDETADPISPRESAFKGLVGRSQKFKECIEVARRAAQSNAPVLLTGESGTGKELFARAIHQENNRADGPFICVNCSAIPPDLTSSEFFGYAPGAFTGAHPDGQVGKFEAASGGTLFLDEIGDMAWEAQCILLRVLESDYVTPVGSTRNIPIDVRIIAATNRDLEQEVQAGRFRADLFYRLLVLGIHLPPLRERPDDIPDLIEHFLKKLEQKTAPKRLSLSPDALNCLMAYHWPGNVRELENVLLQAGLTSEDGVISLHHLPPRVRLGWHPGSAAPSGLVVREHERIHKALAEAQGNRTRAARLLGISRRTLYRKLHRYGWIAREK